MIVDTIINTKLHSVVAELFIRGRKLNNSLYLVFITHILSSAKKFITKHHTLLHHEDST